MSYDYIVDPCGHGDFRTIQEAIDAFNRRPLWRRILRFWPLALYISKGRYRAD